VITLGPKIPIERARFYIGVFNYLWSLPMVPTARDLADWIEAQPWEDPPPELPTWLTRLRQWPPGRLYPPLPDDETIQNGVYHPDARWWEPGAQAGGLAPQIDDRGGLVPQIDREP
jgi:hypothetical protein